MELLSNFLKQIASITRLKLEELMLIVMDKRTHEERLSEPLQTNIKQFEIAVTFPTGCNGISIVTNKNSSFVFISSYEIA